MNNQIYSITKLIIMLILFSLTSACNTEKTKENKNNAKDSKFTIEIVTLVNHPSLNEAIEGFKQGLSSSKSIPLEDLKFTLSNVSGDLTQVPIIMDEIVARHPNLIYVLTTPVASTAIKYTNPASIPLVYAAVTDPVKAKIVKSMDSTTTFASGVSDRYPVEEQIKFIKLIQPNINTLGVFRSSGEENSKILAEWTIQQAKSHGIKTNEYVLNQDQDITLMTEDAFRENDAVIINGDNKLVENIQAVLNVAINYKKPLYSGDPDSVKVGALAAVGPSYFEMGTRAGKIAEQVLIGKDIRSIPSEFPKSFDYIINTKAAKLMGIEIPNKLWSHRSIWTSRSGDTR